MGLMAGRGWNDKMENYADGWMVKNVGSGATAILGASYAQPVVIYGLSVVANPSVASGLVDLVDSSATADADTTKWSVRIASAASQTFSYAMAFPRGMAFDNGIVVTALTVTGSISVLYKARYPQSP